MVSELPAHGEDVDQIHGVGAFQEGLVRFQDDVTCLPGRDLVGRGPEAKFVQQQVLPCQQDVAQGRSELAALLSAGEKTAQANVMTVSSRRHVNGPKCIHDCVHETISVACKSVW